MWSLYWGSTVSVDVFVLVIAICIGVGAGNTTRAVLYALILAILLPVAIAWSEWPFIDVFQPTGEARKVYVLNAIVNAEQVRLRFASRLFFTALCSCAVAWALACLQSKILACDTRRLRRLWIAMKILRIGVWLLYIAFLVWRSVTPPHGVWVSFVSLLVPPAAIMAGVFERRVRIRSEVSHGSPLLRAI
jgi:hypothetical protein